MQQTTLSFYERVMLWNLAGNHQASSLKEASVFLRLIEKLRPSDEEMRETQFLQEREATRWSLPSNDYGTKHVVLEDEEAKALQRALEAQPSVRVSDAAWQLRVIGDIAAPAAAATAAAVPVEA